MKNLLFVSFLLCNCINGAFAQDIKTIKLRHQSVSFSPKGFQIVGVVDDRADTSNIGIIRYTLLSKQFKVNLQNGAAWSLNDFFQSNVEQNPNATPITIHIKELSLGEKPNGLRDEADLDMSLEFYSDKKMLIGYNGESSVQAGLDVSKYVEGHIRLRLETVLKEFDKFWANNHDAYTGKPSLKLTAEISTETDDADRIVYSRQRPLTLDDFQGKPSDISRGAAETWSGIYMRYASQTLNGKVTIKVSILTFFDKTRSWCRTNARTNYTLAHEQIHFDITALKACELLSKVQSSSFTLDNYDKELEQLHKQAEKDMEQLQNDYDKETQHGTIKAQQAKWAEKIKQLLAAQTCF